MRLIFMGTPEFAVPSLEAVVAAGAMVVAVITQPDKQKGRGMQLAPPPIKERALQLGLTVLQPHRLREPGFEVTFAGLQPDVAAVVAYGQLVPASLLRLPRLGFVNVHPSLLPRYRGASPIQQALLDGCEETGVTTMYLDEGMDTGDIILQARTAIAPAEDAGSLHDRLAVLGAELLVESLQQIATGAAPRRPQDHRLATITRRLRREDGLLCWEGASQDLANQVRAYTPWPGAYTFLGRERLKVWRAQPVVSCQAESVPGTVIGVDESGVHVACGSGALCLQEVQPGSGLRMSGAAYARGRALGRGSRFACGT